MGKNNNYDEEILNEFLDELENFGIRCYFSFDVLYVDVGYKAKSNLRILKIERSQDPENFNKISLVIDFYDPGDDKNDKIKIFMTEFIVAVKLIDKLFY